MQCLFPILNWFVLAGIENSAAVVYLRKNNLVKSLYCRIHQAWDSLAISAFLSFTSYFCDFFTIQLFLIESSFLIFENFTQFVLKISHTPIRRFDIKNMCIGNLTFINPKKLSVINGMNPYFEKWYVFLKLTVKTFKYWKLAVEVL